MLLFVFFLCCVLHPIIQYYSVFGKRESLQRFVVEDGAKPPIFGSYSYDPVKQVFVPPPPDNDTGHDLSSSHIPNQIVNNSFIFSTAVGEGHSPTDNGSGAANHSGPVFRKQVTPNLSSNSAAWWARPKLTFKNVISSIHK